jgi:hypothetical protein
VIGRDGIFHKSAIDDPALPLIGDMTDELPDGHIAWLDLLGNA